MTAVKMMLLALVVLMMGCGGNSADLSAPLEGVWLSAIETGGYAPGDLYHRFSPQSLADRMVGRWSNSPETFFDITPAGQWYRVVSWKYDGPEGLNILDPK